MTATQGSRDADTATSHDGRTFSLTMSPHRVFPVGSLVSLTDDEGLIRLAEIETYQLLPDGQMRAAGRVLGTLDGKGLDNSTMAVFRSASVAEADREMITAMNNGAAANLDIGSIASDLDLPGRLIPRRLNRHTLVRSERLRQDVCVRRSP